MNPRQTAFVAAVVMAILAVIVVLLVTGTPSELEGTIADETNDVSVTQGAGPATNTAIADVAETGVVRHGDDLVFTARMNATIPPDLQPGQLDWRWTIFEDGEDTWLVSARFDTKTQASVVGRKSNYASGTVDKTMPGSAKLEGDRLTITVQPTDIPGFPTSFAWSLQTTLDGDLSDPASSLVQDVAPNGGTVKVKP